MAVGNRIRNLRLDRGMRQSDLGKMLGVSQQQIIKYEDGINDISVYAAQRFAAVLNVKPCDICGCCNA